MNNDPKIIVALDYADSSGALKLINQLDPTLCRLKVGKELFTAAGPKFVEELTQSNFGVFLDLKFHDIPNTVAKACTAACNLGVWMLNVHASGGLEMMQAAKQAVMQNDNHPLLIAVTVLTSMNQSELNQIEWENEKNWKGQVYSSSIDKRLFVPRKSKNSLTVNFGHPFGLFTVIGFILSLAAISILINMNLHK